MRGAAVDKGRCLYLQSTFSKSQLVFAYYFLAFCSQSNNRKMLEGEDGVA